MTLAWVAALAILAGCAQTATAPSTTLTPLGTFHATTTTTIPVPPPTLEGYVAAVRDGRTFDLQTGPTTRLIALTHVQVPPIGTCEGAEARDLLASIISGHKVRFDPDGIVWKDDLDVASAMVSFGYAKASDDRYATQDAASVDLDCSATTTSTTLPPPAVTRPKKPKPKAPPKTIAEPEPTEPVTEPARPVETDPPKTDPPDTKPEKTEPPKKDPPATEPAPTPSPTAV